MNTIVSAPRLRAQVNGLNVDSVIHAELGNRGSCRSSTFELTISITEGALNIRSIGLLTGRVNVEIFIYSGGSGVEPPILVGLADSISVDQVNGTARLVGRDYSSVLIDSTFQSAYCNQTASEIANSIAIRHGFDSNIGTSSAMTGSYQDGGFNQVLLNAHSRIISEWDLLTQLARQEHFELFLDGASLVFAPAATIPRSNVLIDIGDVMGIRFHKQIPLSDQTVLTVKSWNSWLGQSLYHSNDRSDVQTSESPVGFNDDRGIESAIIKPNLTSQDAVQLALRGRDFLNERILTVQITMPGDTTMKPLDLVTVSGSDSSFDCNYIVKSIRREFSTTSGFVQYIQGFAVETSALLTPASPDTPNG